MAASLQKQQVAVPPSPAGAGDDRADRTYVYVTNVAPAADQTVTGGADSGVPSSKNEAETDEKPTVANMRRVWTDLELTSPEAMRWVLGILFVLGFALSRTGTAVGAFLRGFSSFVLP